MLPLKKILWPTDFSEPASEGLKIARELATHFSGEILLVHVVAPLPTMHGAAAPLRCCDLSFACCAGIQNTGRF